MKILFRACCLILACLLLPLPASAAVPDLPVGDPARAERRLAVPLDAIVDTRTGTLLTPAALARQLAGTRLLFVGEEHTTPEFHDVQLAVIRALEAAGREVLIGLEMYPWTEQVALDHWIDGTWTEAGFVRAGRWYENWTYPWGYYRDIFLHARAHGLPMYGVNLPREVVQQVRGEGFAALDAAQRAHLPPVIELDSAAHRRLFRAFFEDDDALHTQLPAAALEGLYRAQVAWDAGMGWNALRALEAAGGEDAIMVVLLGAGHVAYDLGAARQLRANGFTATRSLLPVAVRTDGAPTGPVRASLADFLWGVPGRDGPGLPELGVSLAGRIGAEPMQVIRVAAEGSAAAAGIRVGDVLRRLDGAAIESAVELQRLVADHAWGDGVRLDYERAGATHGVEVVFRRPTPE